MNRMFTRLSQLFSYTTSCLLNVGGQPEVTGSQMLSSFPESKRAGITLKGQEMKNSDQDKVLNYM